MQQGRKKNPKYEEEIHMIYACNKEEKNKKIQNMKK